MECRSASGCSICTILLALFLGLSKRRHEIVLLADGATGHRRILQEYSPYLLDQMIGVVTASTLMAYILYATSHETAEKFGTSLLGLTIPFPLYGIFRYLYLVHQQGRRRKSRGTAAERSTTARLRGSLGRRSRRDHLQALRNLRLRHNASEVRNASAVKRQTPGRCVPMAEFNVRADEVNVEQIMHQIRARIREKRGVDYTEEQIQELAKIKLEKFLDPRGVRSDLLEQFQRAAAQDLPPTYEFDDHDADPIGQPAGGASSAGCSSPS